MLLWTFPLFRVQAQLLWTCTNAMLCDCRCQFLMYIRLSCLSVRAASAATAARKVRKNRAQISAMGGNDHGRKVKTALWKCAPSCAAADAVRLALRRNTACPRP